MKEFADLVLSLPGDLSREVENELRRGWHAQAVLAAKEQLEIAQAQPARTWVNGMGRVRLTITPAAYHYWGQRLGYKCWKDKRFLAEFERDNPEARVRSVAPRTVVRVEGRASRVEGKENAAAGVSTLDARPSPPLIDSRPMPKPLILP